MRASHGRCSVASNFRRVRSKGRTIEYELRRSRRRTKNVALTVEGGRVLVSAPVRARVREIDDFVRRNADWIAEQHLDDQQLAIPDQFDECATLPYLGRRLPVGCSPIEGKRRVVVRLEESAFSLAVPAGLGEPVRSEMIRVAVQGWYKERAVERLPALVDRWRPRFGFDHEPTLRIGNQRRAWANCSSDGVLRFSWRVIMLEEPLVEYIVAHELAHLVHFNHSRDFWRLLTAVMPDQETRWERIKKATLKLQF